MSLTKDTIGDYAKLPKGGRKHLKLYMHPPSIPTRFQTIHYDDSEKNAFHSTTPRFIQNHSEIPGPGYYAKSAETINHSHSVKGYGVGFASQLRRFVKPPTDLETEIVVAPNKYHPKLPCYSDSIQNSLSCSFRKPSNPNHQNRNINIYVRTRKGLKPTPGPGDYKNIKEFEKSNGAQSVFKSKTSRTKFDSDGSHHAPPPGLYLVEEAAKAIQPQVYGAISSFKASSRSHHQKLKKPLKFGSLAEIPDTPKEPSSNQTAIPGSGATPIAFPSPGCYNLARGSDAIHKTIPALNSIFQSKTTRFQYNETKSAPGPGHYHPFTNDGSRSFHLNLSQNWSN
ncbi:hypothetical protein HDV02_002057 [Globomyces sp. JEL0801]|nr:hypothetical protein HDV02_002057 [Globomyces sp. JEL0801]